MKEQDLKAKLADLGGQYRATDSVAEREQLTAQIREATVALQDSLAKGAKACPDGTADNPHRVVGMLKTPAHYDSASGMEIPDVYEVGCIVCPPVLVPFDEAEHKFGVDHPSEKDKTGNARKVVRWSHSARGFSPKEAVENWNGGKWVADGKADRVPTTKIFEP
jgi:hypothetical protein